MTSCNNFQKPANVHAAPWADDSVDLSCVSFSASQPLTSEPPEEPFALAFAPQLPGFTPGMGQTPLGRHRGVNSHCTGEGAALSEQTPVVSWCWLLAGFHHHHHQPCSGCLLTVTFHAGCIFFTRVCTSWDYFNSIQETQTKIQMARNHSDESFLILIFQTVLNNIFSTHN